MKRKKVIFLFKNISVDRKQNCHKLILLLKVMEREKIGVTSGFCMHLLKNKVFFSTAIEV